MSTVFLRNGSVFNPTSEADLDLYPTLPGGNYIIIKHPATGALMLQQVDPFVTPTKMYGNIRQRAERILTTYRNRPTSTGVLLAGEKGSGKALRVDQHVYTPNGVRAIGSLMVGDVVYDEAGQSVVVQGVFPQGVRKLFAVEFNDGTSVIADAEHLWAVKQTTRSQRGWSKQQITHVDGKRTVSTRSKVLTTAEIAAGLEMGVKHTIPLCQPVNFPASSVQADRYTIGILIGDGALSSPTLYFSSNDQQIVDHISSQHQVKYVQGYDYRLVDSQQLIDELDQLGLRGTVSNTKFIPDQLKYDSIENRFALLQGLMDSDGTITKRGGITFTTVSQRLANDVVWLARSLGFRSSIQHARRPTYTYKGQRKQGQLAYTVQLTGQHNNRVFRLPHKAERVKQCSSCTKTITNIQPVDDGDAVCIRVENDSHLFLTNDFTVTHNTQLARLIGQIAADQGVPCIIINAAWAGDEFFKLIQSIGQECIVLFDEFEKVYDRDEQKQVLTLLDGVFPSKKLFILTCNDKWLIDDHMRNRPGRIYYLIDFKGLPVEFIEEYCSDNLNAKQHLNAIVKVSRMFSAFNFDMLKAIVEEMNRYDESPEQVLEMLNARPTTDGDGNYAVTITLDGINAQRGTFYPTEWDGSPMQAQEITITYNPSDAEDDDDDEVTAALAGKRPAVNRRTHRNKRQTFTVRQSHLKSFNGDRGEFVYELPDHVIVRFTRTWHHDAQFFSLLA